MTDKNLADECEWLAGQIRAGRVNALRGIENVLREAAAALRASAAPQPDDVLGELKKRLDVALTKLQTITSALVEDKPIPTHARADIAMLSAAINGIVAEGRLIVAQSKRDAELKAAHAAGQAARAKRDAEMLRRRVIQLRESRAKYENAGYHDLSNRCETAFLELEGQIDAIEKGAAG